MTPFVRFKILHGMGCGLGLPKLCEFAESRYWKTFFALLFLYLFLLQHILKTAFPPSTLLSPSTSPPFPFRKWQSLKLIQHNKMQ